MFRSLSIGVLILPLIGCVQRSTDCRWPTEDGGRLDLDDPRDAQHLLEDVRLAEDLAIRYGDIRWGPGPERWQERHAQCLEPSLRQIAARHGVSLQTVLSVRKRLDEPRGFDPAVDVPIGLFAIALGLVGLRRVTKRFPSGDEPLARSVATAMVSVLVGGVTLAFGRLWEGGVASVRLGTDLLSYRGLRLRWTQEPVELFVLGMAIAWVVALLCHWYRARVPG